MTLQLELTYHTNYNGWDLNEEIHPELEQSDLLGELCDMSGELCDNDGEFEYNTFPKEDMDKITSLVHKYVGNDDVNITIEYDRFST